MGLQPTLKSYVENDEIRTLISNPTTLKGYKPSSKKNINQIYNDLDPFDENDNDSFDTENCKTS